MTYSQPATPLEEVLELTRMRLGLVRLDGDRDLTWTLLEALYHLERRHPGGEVPLERRHRAADLAARALVLAAAWCPGTTPADFLGALATRVETAVRDRPGRELPGVCLLEAAGSVARALLDHQLGARTTEPLVDACLAVAVDAVRIATEARRG